jgi:hypothetical protein
MSHAIGAVRTCPVCGGILQPTEPERLTSAEVARAGPTSDETQPGACQCLLCGYLERPATEAVGEPR